MSYRLVVVASVSCGLVLVVEVVQPEAATAIVVTKMHTMTSYLMVSFFPSIARNRYVAQEISFSYLISFAFSKSPIKNPNFLFYNCLLTDFKNGQLRCFQINIISHFARELR